MEETSASKIAFERARAAAQKQVSALDKKSSRLGIIRLVSFVVVLALIIYLSVDVHPLAGIPLVVIGLLGFNKLIGHHQQVQQERDLAKRTVEINDEELCSLEYNFGEFDGAEDYRSPIHPFSGDLDLFGPYSIFQFLNRTSTRVGTQALAHFTQYPLQEIDEIEKRQEAIQELNEPLAWRQEFSATGGGIELATLTSIQQLRDWAKTPSTITESYWNWLIPLMSIVNILWLGAFLYLPFYLVLLGYLPTFLLIRRASERIDAIHEETEASIDVLGRYSSMIGLIEQRNWESRLMRELADHFRLSNDTTATKALGELANDVRQLGLRANPYILLLNVFSFWELRYARRLEAWKQTYLDSAKASRAISPAAWFPLGENDTATTPYTTLDRWLLALGSTDALVSFSGLSYRYPHWIFPEVTPYESATPPVFKGIELHHPLLPPAQSKPNDFSTEARAHINLLTGSNMAGKSTFLRTVGLHIVFAHWGSAVPAKGLSTPLLQVYTSMRTQDNLHSGASAFYAELKRLRVVVDATKRGENVFFLLDEILKGTNSQDRHEGGRALIRQLIRNGAAGIVATHDLELAELSEETGSMSTLRLEVETNEAGELYFDYTVKPGLAKSRNASILMRQMGLGTE